MKLNRLRYVVTICMLISVVLGGCGSKAKFMRKIDLMDDDELLSYYQGIKDQIRDINRGSRINDHFGDRQQDEDAVRWRSSFFLGREGYDLNKKKDLIEKEFIKRNITPQ